MYLKSLAAVTALLVVVGCSVPIKPYYSEASEVYTSSKIKTDVTGIAGLDDNLDYPESFSVLSAVDNDVLKYTLIVPTYDGLKAHGDPSLNLYNFNHSTVLTLKTNAELMAAVDEAIADWNTDYAENKGRNISYLSGSKTNSVDFHYQNGDLGEVAFIRIDSGEFYNHVNDDDSISVKTKVYQYEIRELTELKGFRDLLNQALINMQEVVEEPVSVEVEDTNETVTKPVIAETNTTTETEVRSEVEVTPEVEVTSETETTPAVEDTNSTK